MPCVIQKGDNKSNEAIAIQVNSAVILMTGLFQSALWITALFDSYVPGHDSKFNPVLRQFEIWCTPPPSYCQLFFSEKRLVEAAHHKGKDHMYMTCKLAVLPFAGCVFHCLVC